VAKKALVAKKAKRPFTLLSQLALTYKKTQIMTNSNQLTDPTIRFLSIEGSVAGTCPCCNLQGKVGKFCFQCNDDEGMSIGTCPNCEECGKIGNLCLECGEAEYEDELPDGMCSQCGGQGMRGTLCSECEDQSMLYE
jgi:ribosomal protein L32